MEASFNITDLQQLADTLALPEGIITDPTLTAPIAAQVQKSLESCRQGVEKLEKRLAKIKSAPSPAGLREKAENQFRKALYPFKESTLAKLRETVSELRNNLSLALHVLQIPLGTTAVQKLNELQTDVTALNQSFEAIRLDGYNERIHRWLLPPDPSSNHNTARRKWQPKTGTWFIDGDSFPGWRIRPNTFLWLHGIRESFMLSCIVLRYVRRPNLLKQLAAERLFYARLSFKRSCNIATRIQPTP